VEWEEYPSPFRDGTVLTQTLKAVPSQQRYRLQAMSYGVKFKLHQNALPHRTNPARPTSTYSRRSKALCKVGNGNGDPKLRWNEVTSNPPNPTTVATPPNASPAMMSTYPKENRAHPTVFP